MREGMDSGGGERREGEVEDQQQRRRRAAATFISRDGRIIRSIRFFKFDPN